MWSKFSYSMKGGMENKNEEVYFVYNRDTGRDVKVGSKTYERLVREGANLDKPFLKKVKSKSSYKNPYTSKDVKIRTEIPLYSGDISKINNLGEGILDMNELYSSVPPNVQKRLKKLQSNKTTRSLANISRGWSVMSPKKGIQRHNMLKICGEKCFLLPSKEGFPICPYDHINNKPICELSCAGLLSAKRRAKQWGYDDIASEADKIYSKVCK